MPFNVYWSERLNLSLLAEISDFMVLYFYLHNYTPGIYADGCIVFVLLFVRLYVSLLVPTSLVEFTTKFCVKVSQVVSATCLSENIHILIIVTLEGKHSLHDPGP